MSNIQACSLLSHVKVSSFIAPVRHCSLNHVTMFSYNTFAAAMLDTSQSIFLWQGTPVIFEKGRLVIWSDLNTIAIYGKDSKNLLKFLTSINLLNTIVRLSKISLISYLKAFPTFFDQFRNPKTETPIYRGFLPAPNTRGKSGFYCIMAMRDSIHDPWNWILLQW